MKKLLLLLLTVVGANAATYDYDFVRGLDLTGQSSITAAQLNQLVDGASPYPGKGLVIRRSTRPSVTTSPRFTNYLWLDLSSGNLKSYQGVGDNDTNWVTATIGFGSIATANLAGSAVTSDKIAANAVNTTNIANNAVTSDKIGGGQVLHSQLGVNSVSNDNIMAGVITGDRIATLTILNTNLADLNITGSKLQSATITGDKIAANTIASGNLCTNSVDTTNIVAGAVGNTQLATTSVTTNKIAITGGGSYQMLAVDPTASFVRWTTPIVAQSITIAAGNYTAGAVGYTNAHRFGSRPTFVRCTLTNTIPEYGYSAGDEIELSSSDSTVVAFTVSSDVNNVYISINTLLTISRRDAGSGHGRGGLSDSSWGYKLYVYK